MRKLHLALGLLTFALATDALANYKESYYAGVQGGRQVRGITRNFLGSNILVDDGASSIDFGARVYAGYQINEYFSFELGYGSYHDKKYKATTKYCYALTSPNTPPSACIVSNPAYDPTDPLSPPTIPNPLAPFSQTATFHGDVVARGFDASLKGVWPIFDGWNVFGKVGVAFINQTIGENLVTRAPTKYSDPQGPNQNQRTSQRNTGFSYGFGGGYDFDEGRIEIGATRMNAASAFPTLDFVYIGISGFFF